MAQTLRRSFAALCRETRIGLDVTQQQLADAAGVTRGYIAMVEGGRANPSLALVERIGGALGLEIRLVGQPPIITGRERQRDLVHARCSGYVERRLRKASLAVAREVELVHGRVTAGSTSSHSTRGQGHSSSSRSRPASKTWVSSSASSVGTSDGPSMSRGTWDGSLAASASGSSSLRAMRSTLRFATTGKRCEPPFRCEHPRCLPRSTRLSRDLDEDWALIDPTSRRQGWLIRARIDGRRTIAPFRDYAGAAARFTSG